MAALPLLILANALCWTHMASIAIEREPLLLRQQFLLAPPGHGHGHGCFSQNSRTKNGATILEMKHVGHCFKGTRDWNRGVVEERLTGDDVRVRSMQSRIREVIISSHAESSARARIPINSGIGLQTLNYVVTIAIGSRNLTVIVDTGSDLTWVQCQPCKLCYSQPEPLFDPAISPSYNTVRCGSQACQDATGNSGFCGTNAPAVCNYAVNYGDGSYTHGDLGTDRVVLGTVTVEHFVFGCGRNNKGLFGAAAGLMGLGKSKLSLISQTYNSFDGVFSYCLPDAESTASGSLVLGSDTSVYKNTTPVSYTRLGVNPHLYGFYIVNMTGLTIGGVALQSLSFGKSGVLIDSGTVITRLPPSIYRAFKAEFLNQFSGYPVAPSFSILDTCFNLSAYEEVSVPTVRLQFEGDTALSVDVAGMVYVVKRDASQVCLALASLAYEDEIGIIGNYQQRNTRVIYDTQQMRIGFAKEACSFS